MTFYLSKKPEPQCLERICESFKVERSTLQFGIALRLFVSHWEHAFAAKLTQHGLGDGRFSVLVHLHCAEPKGLRPSELAEKMGVTRGNLTGLLTGLEKTKLVGRTHESADRRSSRIQLKDKGRQLLNRIGSDYFRIYRDMQKALGRAQGKELQKALESWMNKTLGER
jgi:DNA-binding MarR family transcriptional regulator